MSTTSAPWLYGDDDELHMTTVSYSQEAWPPAIGVEWVHPHNPHDSEEPTTGVPHEWLVCTFTVQVAFPHAVYHSCLT